MSPRLIFRRMKNGWVVIVASMLLLTAVPSVCSCGLQKRVEQPEPTVVDAEALERYEFAVEALEIWEEMQAITVGAFEVALALDEQISCRAEVINLVNRHSQLEHRLKWLYAPHDTLEIKTSLLDDSDLISDCVARLAAACQFRDEGDQAAYQRYTREVAELFNDFFGEKRVPSEETEVKLINLKLQAEKDLNWR